MSPLRVEVRVILNRPFSVDVSQHRFEWSCFDIPVVDSSIDRLLTPEPLEVVGVEISDVLKAETLRLALCLSVEFPLCHHGLGRRQISVCPLKIRRLPNVTIKLGLIRPSHLLSRNLPNSLFLYEPRPHFLHQGWRMLLRRVDRRAYRCFLRGTLALGVLRAF